MIELKQLSLDLVRRGVRVVSEADWAYLSELEVTSGQRLGKVREKVLGIDEALEILAGQSFVEQLKSPVS